MDAHKQREMLERLRAHLEHKTTDLSAYALKVPAEHYVSDDQLALEVDALFKQRPVLVALTPHIPNEGDYLTHDCLLYTSPSPRDRTRSRMPSSA